MHWLLEKAEKQRKAFAESLKLYSDEDLRAALKRGRWYDRQELRTWQAKAIFEVLEDRREGRRLPVEGMPALTFRVGPPHPEEDLG